MQDPEHPPDGRPWNGRAQRRREFSHAAACGMPGDRRHFARRSDTPGPGEAAVTG